MKHLLLTVALCHLAITGGAAGTDTMREEGQETADTLVVRELRGRGITFSHDNSVVLFNNGQAKFDDMFHAQSIKRSL